MLKFWVGGLMMVSLTACAQKSAYEAAVEDLEPRYCYKSLAGVTCYEKPYHRDEKRLVNYFGPAPERYDKPAARPAPRRDAPQAVSYWVKDPEPLPTPVAHGDLADRPWLTRKARVEDGPSAHPESYRVRRDGATYIIRELPAEVPATQPLREAEAPAAGDPEGPLEGPLTPPQAAPVAPRGDTEADPDKLNETANLAPLAE